MLRIIAFMIIPRLRTALSIFILGLVIFPSVPANAFTLNQFAIPTSNSQPHGISGGPDGNNWFTEGNGNNIGQITTAGVITEFPVLQPTRSPMALRLGRMAISGLPSCMATISGR